MVEVGHVLLEHTAKMLFAEDQDVIKAFAPDAAQQSFTDGVRPWCSDRRAQHLNPASDRYGVEMRTVLRVVVADQVRGRFAEGRRLPELLRNPGVGRGLRHADVDDAPRAELRNDEGEQL